MQVHGAGHLLPDRPLHLLLHEIHPANTRGQRLHGLCQVCQGCRCHSTAGRGSVWPRCCVCALCWVGGRRGLAIDVLVTAKVTSRAPLQQAFKVNFKDSAQVALQKVDGEG